MIALQNTKWVNVVPPQSVTTGATATGTFDTLGFDYATVVVHGDTASSDIAVLNLAEADSGTTYTTIATFDGSDTTDGFTIPSADTSNGVSAVFHVDLTKRKRYLKLSCDPAVVQVVTASALLSRAGDTGDAGGADVTVIG